MSATIRKMAPLADGAGAVMDLSSVPDLNSVLPESRLRDSLDAELEPQEAWQAIAEARDWLSGSETQQ